MSRLVESDIEHLAKQIEQHSKDLEALCGTSLGGIAMSAANKKDITSNPKIAIVPVTSGLGIIGGFAHTVSAITNFLGYPSTVTSATDLEGISQAVRDKYDIIFAANDSTFLAVNLPKQLSSDNTEATGRGFAAALKLAANGLEGKKVLLLGAGPVGQSAADVMIKSGALITIYDIDIDKSKLLQEKHNSVVIANSLENALADHTLVYDATPTGSFLCKDMFCTNTILAAPGVPLCLEKECDMKGRLIFDVLELGVATMLYDVL